MATLLMLEAGGELFRYDAALDFHQQAERAIFFLPRSRNWMTNVLPGLESTWNIQERPIEQVDALLATYCSGEPLAFGTRFKPLTHLGDGVWQLKTADVRIFGWFVGRDCFIASDGALARDVKARKAYRPFAEQAVRFRNALLLDEPKFTPGEDPLNVVSNFCYP